MNDIKDLTLNIKLEHLRKGTNDSNYERVYNALSML